MLPFLLILSLFVLLTLVGRAVVSLLRPRLGILWGWFISPTVGLALLIVLMTRLNMWGIPVKTFGPWLAGGLAVFAAAVLWWRRPAFPWRQLRPFALLTLLFVVYAGWPMFRFGFNWISYGNDDMANYCLAADRFLNHGYYDLPEQTQLEGRDYPQHYWFMHGLQQIRPGSELVLAFVSSVSGLNPHEVFMPVILMFSMLQIWAMGAVAMFRGRYRKIALLAFFLFATSPLFGLGTLYQLIAQVGGIAILLTALAVLLNTRECTWRRILLGALITSCLGIFYPEVAPFVALSIIFYGLHLRYTDPTALKRFSFVIIGTAVLTFVFLGTSTYQFLNTLVMQSVGSAGLGSMAEINDQSGGLVLFPWTLVPSFVPMLFGLHAFGVVGVDPWISFQIGVGVLFLFFFVWMAFSQMARREPAGYIAVIMLSLGCFLFFKGQDFGLFKLAMFAQPVITLLLAHEFYKLIDARRRLGRWVVAVFFVCTIPSHVYYSFASLGTYGGGLSEIVGASEYGVHFTPPKDIKFDAIESDMSNVVGAKLLSQYTKGIDTRFLSRSYMDNIANIAVLSFLRTPDPDLGPQARLIEKLSLLSPLLPPEIMKGDVADYKVMTINKLDNNWTETGSRHLGYQNRLFVSIRSELDHFNKANNGTGWSIQNIYQYKLEKDVKDRLVFIHSELGPHYYSSARFKAAFFQREPEPVTQGRGDIYFHGTGRYNMFRLVNPSPQIRVVVDFTRTPLGGDRYELPRKAVVIGEDDYPLGFVGSGSARVFSPPIKPELFEQQSYLTIDFADKPAPIGKNKTGFMTLWGVKFNLDDRRLVGFTRDISIITEEQYQRLNRPAKISQFPEDLSRHPGLEYSGIFEDGWVGPESFFKLAASHPGQVLFFKGFIPDTPAYRERGLDLTISINDKPTEVVNLRSGEFTLTRLIREPAAITTVRLNFSGSMPYGLQDTRHLSAFIRELSISDLPDLASFRAIKNRTGEGFALDGVDLDGWIGRTAKFDVPAFSEFKVLKVDLEMPGWAPRETNDLKVSLNGRTYSTQTVPRATYHSVYVPILPQPGNTVTLESSAAFPLPEGNRDRSFLIKNLTFENLTRTDLFARGWHPSGYLFSLDGVDQDGWVAKSAGFRFPATAGHKQAIVEVMRYPARADYPVAIVVNGAPAESRPLKLETTERITVPLSPDHETTLSLSAAQAFALSAGDPRERSFRIVNIDFN